MTTAIRIMLIPVAVVLFVAFQLWALVDKFPSYARSIWMEWRTNTRALLHFIHVAFHGEKESNNG